MFEIAEVKSEALDPSTKYRLQSEKHKLPEPFFITKSYIVCIDMYNIVII